MQVDQAERLDVPNADSVLKFLTQNPDFFNQHSDLLPRLTIPHRTGQAVSLIEKQVRVLCKNRPVENKPINQANCICTSRSTLRCCSST